MTRYRLYHLADFELAGSDEIEAEDDRSAAVIARGRTGTGWVELWCGPRRVRTILPPAGGG